MSSKFLRFLSGCCQGTLWLCPSSRWPISDGHTAGGALKLALSNHKERPWRKDTNLETWQRKDFSSGNGFGNFGDVGTLEGGSSCFFYSFLQFVKTVA